MAHLKAFWDAYGPGHGVLNASAQVSIHGLQNRAELNGTTVTIQAWDAASQRFIVLRGGTRENIKVKAVNLKGLKGSFHDYVSWIESENHFGPLPAEMAVLVAAFLRAPCVVGLGNVCRGLCNSLLLSSECQPLWEELLRRDLGPSALSVARCARPFAVGPSLFPGALGLTKIFDAKFEIVNGGVDGQAAGMDVVACPCIRNLLNVGIGAQGAVRRAAGAALEEAVRKISLPLDEASVTLVPGGMLAKRVALCVTEPPASVQEARTREEQLSSILAFLGQLHSNLLRAVREAGLRSVAMPTLGTGGVGFPTELVATAIAWSIHEDFCKHPVDPLTVRVACWDHGDVPVLEHVKSQLIAGFYSCVDMDIYGLARALLPNLMQDGTHDWVW
jgi:O-acetyl-ADP-ribose deacetylase (regulator of RNase III)